MDAQLLVEIEVLGDEMKTLFLALTLFGFLTGFGVAGGTDGSERCAALKTDAVRLACLEHLSKSNSGGIEAPPTGDWKVGFQISKIDDTREVILRTQALEIFSGKYDNISKFTLVIGCKENTTSLWIHFGGHFMSDHQHGRVTYRIDKNPAQRKRFQESNDHEYLGLGSGRTAIPFVKALFGASRLYVEATPHSENSVNAEFNISGLEEAVKPLRKSCHW